MIGYPLDSELAYDSELNPYYDRAVSSAPLRKLIKTTMSDGVLPDISTNFQVLAGEINSDNEATCRVLPGFAIVGGCMKLEEEERTLIFQAPDLQDRIDTVVLRLNANRDVRECDLYVIKGIPSTNPERPALTRNEQICEIGLADVFRTKSVVGITQEKVTDTRYEDARCGVISPLGQLDLDTIYIQVQAELDKYRNETETEQAAWFTEQQNAFSVWRSTQTESFEEWREEEQSKYLAWIDYIKGILDEETAGHLQNEIDALSGRVDTVVEEVRQEGEQIKKDVEEALTREHLIFNNVTATFTSDDTYADYPYKATISCEGVTSDYIPTVNLSMEDATSGVISPIAESGEGVVIIYSSEDTGITIPTILCVKGVSA